MIGTDMSTVSRHLAVLKNAGIIEDHKRGSQVYYKLRVNCVLDFFECVESVMACNVRTACERSNEVTILQNEVKALDNVASIVCPSLQRGSFLINL